MTGTNGRGRMSHFLVVGPRVEVWGVYMGRDDLLGWRGERSWAGLLRVMEWSHRIPKQNGPQLVEWSCWSGVAILGVECSQTGPNSGLFTLSE